MLLTGPSVRRLGNQAHRPPLEDLRTHLPALGPLSLPLLARSLPPLPLRGALRKRKPYYRNPRRQPDEESSGLAIERRDVSSSAVGRREGSGYGPSTSGRSESASPRARAIRARENITHSDEATGSSSYGDDAVNSWYAQLTRCRQHPPNQHVHKIPITRFLSFYIPTHAYP